VLRFFEGGHMFMLQDRTAVPAMIEFLLEGPSGPSA
jgi:surfactin synthase thioesterase subunit